MTIVYEPPWICYKHSYWTQDKAAFFEHLHNVPHEIEGKDICHKCGVEVEYRIPFEGLNEPVIVLCQACEKIPNAREYVRAQRRAEFPPEKAAQWK